MAEVFEPFRMDLSRIISDWHPKLETIREEISSTNDKDKRLATIIEYNRFKELLSIMRWLHNDKDAISKNSQTIGSIRRELYLASQYEHVGDDILKLTEQIEKLIDGKATVHKISMNIKRCIILIKQGEGVIPSNAKQELIDRLNKCIIERNKRVRIPIQGIILQLREDKDFVNCAAALFVIECKTCGHAFRWSGNSDLDIYAPPVCPECMSCDLFRSQKPFALVDYSTQDMPKGSILRCMFHRVARAFRV